MRAKSQIRVENLDPEETMENSDIGLRSLKEDFHRMCSELDVDQSLTKTAWESYLVIRHKYTLEVSPDKLELYYCF